MNEFLSPLAGAWNSPASEPTARAVGYCSAAKTDFESTFLGREDYQTTRNGDANVNFQNQTPLDKIEAGEYKRENESG